MSLLSAPSPTVLPSSTPIPAWNSTVEAATADVYEKVKPFIPPVEWIFHAPYIHLIRELKKQRNAVILAHNYQKPEIYHCVADVVGDSLQLAQYAAQTSAEVVIQAGVHFMAETSKLLNPDKMVLIPDSRAGCSLAQSITGEDIKKLRSAYPEVPIIAYVNTSAEVKAEVDICCTSSNALKIVESFGVERVILVPDRYLAQNIATQTKVEIISWAGACEVHERFNAAELNAFRAHDPSIRILAHPECLPEVVEVADFSGSTSAMISYVRQHKPQRVLLVTECSMADNLAIETQGQNIEFVRPCHLCPHMQRITLPKILTSLQSLTEKVHVETELAIRARRSLQRMLEVV